MNNKKMILVLIVFLAVGFAAVSTSLIINGIAKIASNQDDFNVIFTLAKLNGEKRNDFIEPTKKQSITFETDRLTTIDEEAKLDYEVANTSRNYDADVVINCIVPDNDFVIIDYEPKSMTVEAGDTSFGSLTAKLIKASTEDKDIKIKCTLEATATERTSLGDIYEPNDGYLLLASGDVDEGFWQMYDEICEESAEKCEEFDNEWEIRYEEYLENNKFLWDYVDTRSVETINIVNSKKVPENALLSWDASEQHNGSIMAYTLDENNNGMYELYIGQKGGVVANPDSNGLFSNFNSIYAINGLENLDTSKVTDMSYMFYNCALRDIDISSFDTSNVTDMRSMFYNSLYLVNVNLSGLNTSNVTTMEEMFTSNERLESVNLSGLNLNNVTKTTNMFRNCSKLKTIDLSGTSASNIRDMSYMFFSCSKVTELDLSGFDTSNVTDMRDLFYGCATLTELDLSNFDTSNVTNMSYMFASCLNLTELNVSNFDTSNVTNMSNMFSYCRSLPKLDISNFITDKVTSIEKIFENCTNLVEIDISSFDFSNITNFNDSFVGLSDNTKVIVKDITAREWVLKSVNGHPSKWTTDSVVVKTQEA